jgi:DNA-binding XRE family transcriptional regulator
LRGRTRLYQKDSANLCRTYGAGNFLCRVPAFPRWARLWRADGTGAGRAGSFRQERYNGGWRTLPAVGPPAWGIMKIRRKLRELRLAQNLSQGDIQERTGLLRAYTSRVEIENVTPSVATLEKYAAALDVPFYSLFYDDPRRAELDQRLEEQKMTAWRCEEPSG